MHLTSFEFRIITNRNLLAPTKLVLARRPSLYSDVSSSPEFTLFNESLPARRFVGGWADAKQRIEQIRTRHGARECESAKLRECETARLRERATATLRECATATLRECATARLRECATARLRECATARLRERETARLRECETARLCECEIVKLANVRL